MTYQRYLGPAMLGVAAIVILAVLGVPVVGLLPFLVFLACPLMMIFMMRGMSQAGSDGHAGCHGSHQHGDADAPPTREFR